MARIELNKISAGDTLSTATSSGVNADIDQWNTETGSIDGENVREEGIDRRNLANGAFVEPIPSSLSGTYAKITSTTTVNAGNIGLSSSSASVVTGALIGPVYYDPATDAGLKINVSFQFETPIVQTTDSTLPHFSAVRPNWSVQLGYRVGNSVGSYGAVAGTKRELSIETAGCANTDGVTMAGHKWIDSLSIAHMFQYGSSGAPGFYFQLFAWEDGSGTPLDFSVNYLNMFATRYKR